MADEPIAADPRLSQSRKFTWVWIAPIAAAVIAIWLAYSTISNRGPQITILFESATGLEAGETSIKFKDVEIGRVEAVRINDDLKTIEVTARMVKGSDGLLTSQAQFWIVRPRVGTGGVSGLDTLVSGAYIEFDPGGGEPSREFTGQEEPPLVRSSVPGTRYELRAQSLDGVSRGSPIYHRGIEVGNVLGYELRNETEDLIIYIFVREPHDQLVTNNTRFWNASGLTVQAGTEGLGLQVESVQALLTGGIAFINSGGEAAIEIASAGSEFTLYENELEAREAVFDERVPLLVNFNSSIRGLRVGAPVELRGIKVGEVTSIDLELNAQTSEIRTPVVIEIEPQRFSFVGGEIDGADQYTVGDEMVARGLRARLDPGSFITGELIVSLVFDDTDSYDGLDHRTSPPTLPAVTSELEELTASVSGILQKIASLPIETIVDEMRAAVGSARGLIESPDLKASITGLNSAMADLEGLMSEVRGEAGPLVRSMRNTANEAERAIRAATALLVEAEGAVGPESPLSYDLQQMMQELTSAARSVRLFADYLERHPEALLRGKRGGFQ